MMNSSKSPRLARASLLAGVLAMGAVLVADSACVQDQDFLIVENAVWVDDACSLSASADPLGLLTIDVKFDGPISMGFVLSNTQTQNQNSTTGIDDTEIQLESAEVNLSFSGGGVSPSSFDVTIPSDSISGGDTEAILVHLHGEITQSLRATMAALPAGTIEHLEMEVIFKGRKAGQVGNTKIGTVESRPYVFPFDICYGCLEDCSCGVCPTTEAWAGGVCGVAAGEPIIAPSCAAP